MKVDFPLPADGHLHRFCIDCRAEHVVQIHQSGKTMYKCPACHHVNTRAIYFDKHRCWTDKIGELWHEACGVFVQNQAGQYLFFQRTEYPFVLTVPSGHVDAGEIPAAAAARELKEEVGLDAKKLQHLASADIQGDSCSGGADCHRWHAYLTFKPQAYKMNILEEGKKPVWLSLEEAKAKGIIYPVAYMIDHYQSSFEK